MNKDPLTIAEIQSIVAERFGVPRRYLMQERRDRVSCVPRHVAMYLCREFTGQTLQRIATAFARADHGAVVYAITRVPLYYASSETAHAAIDDLKKTLSERVGPDGG